MDLTTQYLGFTLPHPLIPGASPMVDHLDVVCRLEDAGAPMIIMHSLFEEQFLAEQYAVEQSYNTGADSNAEALSYLPQSDVYTLAPDQYLEQIRKIKRRVKVPVVASLNGSSPGGWLSFAQLMQEAGADALELNLYDVVTDLSLGSDAVERQALEVVESVLATVTIPVAVKLSPFYTAFGHFAAQLDSLGVAGLVIFNRFFQPDIDIEQLELHRVNLSNSEELLLRLRWLAILSGRIKASLAVTGGVHTASDVIKSTMAGAHGIQMVSALLKHGPQHLAQLRTDLERWLVDHAYESLEQMRGSMNLQRCSNPHAYERANYVRILQSWDYVSNKA